MTPALAHADAVVTPSAIVPAEARRAGWSTGTWKVVPNALLYGRFGPCSPTPMMPQFTGPVRVLARLGQEKGVLSLVEAAADRAWPRRLEVVLAPAGFEEAGGTQSRLLAACRAIVDDAPHISLTAGGLTWRQVPGWLARASVVLVPSLRETFGLVALEAMSVGTPVVAYRVGNLPALLERAQHTQQLLADPSGGPDILRRRVEELLADPLAYGRTSKAVYHLAQDYRPPRIAQLFLKAVS